MPRKNIKLELISPKKKTDGIEREFWDHQFLSLLRGVKTYSIPSLALLTIAALTPPDVEIHITDENVEDIDFDKDVDLVGITSNTFLAPRAYEIADEFRKREVTVILGGVHVSMLPAEAIKHADAVVVGEAENVWTNLIDDYRENRLQQLYQSSKIVSLANQPIPRYDLLKREKYSSLILQTTRGCPFDCEFCMVRAFSGRKIRCKPIHKVIGEIKTLIGSEKKLLFFADDNFTGNKKRTKELLHKLIPFRITYEGQFSLDVAKDEELLNLLAESGCKRVVVGLESLSESNLILMGKNKVNRIDKYIKDIIKIQSYGIEVYGSFIFGYDFDDDSVFEKTLEFINEVDLALALLNILTPYPGTRLYKRLEKENRLLHKDWSKYEHSHVCFKPKLMTSEALQNGYTWIRQQVYSYESIFERLRGLWSLWNQTHIRLWDRVSPILINLDSNDIAFSYPKAIHPKQFIGLGDEKSSSFDKQESRG